MTTVTNEMICGTVDSSLNGINLTGELKVTKEGKVQSINSGIIYDTTNSADPKKYIGSYSINADTSDYTKRSISINISDTALMVKSVTAINTMITDLETKYTVTA